jgi:hypothetical protein
MHFVYAVANNIFSESEYVSPGSGLVDPSDACFVHFVASRPPGGANGYSGNASIIFISRHHTQIYILEIF